MKSRNAVTLRRLAHELEVAVPDMMQFTCNMVNHNIGAHARRVYEDVFELCNDVDRNEVKLWNLPERQRHKVRVLMLCFAAAMADAGDFR